MLLQVVLRGGPQAGALARVDGLGRKTEILARAEADLDEYRRRAVLHHQIDLAERTPVVAPEQGEPGAFEMTGGEGLRRRTVSLARGSGDGALLRACQ